MNRRRRSRGKARAPGASRSDTSELSECPAPPETHERFEDEASDQTVLTTQQARLAELKARREALLAEREIRILEAECQQLEEEARLS